LLKARCWKEEHWKLAHKMGLIRKAIILGGILLALPTPPVPIVAGQPALQSSTFATIEAAAETVADFKGFCERRPQACATGQYIAYALEGKAKYTARLIYQWANPTASGSDVQTADAAPSKPHAGAAPNLRLAALAEPKPTKIEDLLRRTAD
jgi:Family of unknown function (DUF5330)